MIKNEIKKRMELAGFVVLPKPTPRLGYFDLPPCVRSNKNLARLALETCQDLALVCRHAIGIGDTHHARRLMAKDRAARAKSARVAWGVRETPRTRRLEDSNYHAKQIESARKILREEITRRITLSHFKWCSLDGLKERIKSDKRTDEWSKKM